MFFQNTRVQIILWALFWFIVLGAGFDFLVRNQLLFANKTVRSIIIKNYNSKDIGAVLSLSDRIETEGDQIPRYLFLGGSQVKECVKDDQGVTIALSDSLGQDVEFANMATGYGNFYDNLRLEESLAGTKNLIYMIGVSPSYFTWADSIQFFYDVGKDSQRKLQYKYPMLAPSDTGISIVKDHDADISLRAYFPGFQTAYTFCKIGQKVFQHILYEKLFPSLDNPLDEDARSKPTCAELKMLRYERLKYKFPKEFEKYSQTNRAMIMACIDEAKKQGNEVILVDLPYTPILEVHRDTLVSNYEPYIDAIAHETDTPILSLRYDVFVEADFVDGIHMSESGQKKAAALLVDELTQWSRKVVNQ